MKKIVATSIFVLALLQGILFAQTQAKNVILLIGDGMGLAQIQAAYFQNGNSLQMLRMPVTGLHQTRSSDNLITDSGAGGTALACGIKTRNGAIGVDSLLNPVESILEMAERIGMSTGLVATSGITHATPAAFAAHVPSRSDDETIALHIARSGVDFVAGGGYRYFINRKDGKDLAAELRLKGYQVFEPGQSLPPVITLPTAYFADSGHLPRVEQRGDFLENATRAAINSLSTNEKGFFLMVEGSQIDWGAHANSETWVINEVIDFDKAVAAALEFAEQDGNTLVIVTADHETGGLTIVGNKKKGESKKIRKHFSTMDHSAVMVPVFAFGPGAEIFTGAYENVEINTKMRKALGL